MKKILFIGFILIAFLACESEDGTIMGTASANTDSGLVTDGITVKLYTEDAQLFTSTTTDNDGNFSFNDLESGNYYIGATITIGGDIYDTGNRPQIVYVSDEIVKEVTLNLTKK